jgi:hypothetical protein
MRLRKGRIYALAPELKYPAPALFFLRPAFYQKQQTESVKAHRFFGGGQECAFSLQARPEMKKWPHGTQAIS